MNKSASNRRQVLGTTLLGACALSMGLMAAPAMAQGNVKVLSIGMPFSPLSMDPSISGNGRAGVHLSPAYEPLLRTQADGKFAPGLATAWQLSADSKEATFTLRQNAKFSDGEPVTAEAVKKSLEYFVGKKGPFAANFSAMTGIEVLDKFNGDAWVDAYSDMLGVDPNMIVAGDQVAMLRDQRNQAMAAKEQMAAMQQQAATAKDLAAAKTVEPSALTNVIDMYSGYNTP